MSRYRKKSAVVEARQLVETRASMHAVYQWVEANTQGSFDLETDEIPASGVSIDPTTGFMVIATLVRGQPCVLQAKPGDYIVRGVQGEFYPCKPDIFEATYEAVDESLDPGEVVPGPIERIRQAIDEMSISGGRKVVSISVVFDDNPEVFSDVLVSSGSPFAETLKRIEHNASPAEQPLIVDLILDAANRGASGSVVFGEDGKGKCGQSLTAVGVWLERILRDRNELIEMVHEIIKEKK